MTRPGGDTRVERILESALGALSDWLELVRQHEELRRERLEAEAHARREHAARIVMVVLGAGTIAVLFWLSRR